MEQIEDRLPRFALRGNARWEPRHRTSRPSSVESRSRSGKPMVATHDAPRRPRLATTCAAGLCIIGALSGAVVTAPAAATFLEKSVPLARRDADHLYRIKGKVRLLFFWVSADDVGGARITRRGGNADQSIALLIGSEPARAPRGVNEWGYIREDSVGDSTTVFGIRTLTDGDSPDQAEARRTAPGRMAELGVLCSTVSRLEASSRTTTVYVGREATYRDVESVLGVVERSARWKGLHTIRSADTAPGFLTALDVMLRATALAARESRGRRGVHGSLTSTRTRSTISSRVASSECRSSEQSMVCFTTCCAVTSR